MPVVAAARFERDIGDRNVQAAVFRQAGEIGFAAEVFCVCRVLAAARKGADGAASDRFQNFRDLRIGDAVVFADGDVGVQLALHARHCGERGDGGDFAGSPVEVVAPEDVAEQVRLEIFVDCRSEFKERTPDRRAAEFRLVGGAEIDALSRRKRAWLPALCIPDTRCFPLFQQNHVAAERIQAARETAVGIELSQNLLDLVYGQTGVKPCRQRGFQFRHVSACRICGDGGDLLFLCVQCVHVIIGLRVVDDAEKSEQNSE